MNQYVYFFLDQTAGAIKIGFSGDPDGRLKALQVATPSELVAIRYVKVENGPLVERLLHEKFKSLKIRGEWFKAAPELLLFAREGVLPEPEPVPVQDQTNGEQLSLADVSTRTGIPIRTLRYYLAERLLPKPNGKGTKSWYSATHVKRVERIKALQKQGLALEDIRRRMEYAPDETVLIEADGKSPVWIEISPTMSLHANGPVTVEEIQRFISDMLKNPESRRIHSPTFVNLAATPQEK